MGALDLLLDFHFRALSSLKVPASDDDARPQKSEFLAKVNEIAANAVGDACTLSNPRTITPEVMAKLLTCTYYGTEVDF